MSTAETIHDEIEAQQGPGKILHTLWRHKWLVLLGGVIGLVVGAVMYVRATPIYQSNAQVLVINNNANALPVAGLDARYSVVQDYVSTQVYLLKSPVIIRRAVEKAELRSLPTFAKSGDPVGAIMASIRVFRDDEDSGASANLNNIINLSFHGPHPEDAQTVLSAVIDSYQDFLDETTQNVSDNAVKQITDARHELSEQIATKEKAYADFRTTSPLLLFDDSGRVMQQERVAKLDATMAELRMKKAEYEQRLSKIEESIGKGHSSRQIMALIPAELKLDGSADLQFKQQMMPLVLKRQELVEGGVGEKHPSRLAIEAQISYLKELAEQLSLDKGEGFSKDGAGEQKANEEEKKDNLVDNDTLAEPWRPYVRALRQHLELITVRIASLDKLWEGEETKARRLLDYAERDSAYRKQLNRHYKLFDTIVERLQEVHLVRNHGGVKAQPISGPTIGQKVAPKMFQLILGGLVAGLGIGAGLAFLADFTDKGFRTPEEIRKKLGLPVIGHIPVLVANEEAVERSKQGEKVVDPYVCAYYRPKSPEAEAYRSVRTALYFSTQGKGHNLVQVTSPNMGDGKSTLVTNLAVSIAQSGKNIILVDADLRRPRAHKIFGLSNSVGLAQVVAGEATLREAAQQTVIPNLSIMSCGPLPPNPSELLTSPSFQETLELLRSQYDFVLVDTPPLLVVTDPSVVAPRVDGVILTIRLTKQCGPQAERAREMLSALGAKVVGVVVNGLTRKAGAKYGSSYYSYSYESTYEYEQDEDEQTYYVEEEK